MNNASHLPVTKVPAEGKRWRATALHDAGTLTGKARSARGIMECTGPLALVWERLKSKSPRRKLGLRENSSR